MPFQEMQLHDGWQSLLDGWFCSGLAAAGVVQGWPALQHARPLPTDYPAGYAQ